MISVVVPAHNEEENLPILIENVRRVLFKKISEMEIVLVDDNSTDSTPEICDSFSMKYKNVRTIHREGNPGMGNALKEGTETTRGSIVVWLMADLSDDLNAIPKMITKIKTGYDVVFGSRYMEGGSSGDLSAFKRLASSGFSFLSRVFIGVGVHDITNAFRAFRIGVFKKVQPESGDFGISPEFALKAHLREFRLSEVPVVYKDRKKGLQKFRMFSMSRKYFTIFLKAFFWRLSKRYKN